MDIQSTSKGVLFPRLTEVQIQEIIDPANGLMVMNTDDNHFYFYDDGDGVWKEIAIGTCTITPVPTVPTVFNALTGETWIDRNIGAYQVAQSSDDGAACGCWYQWGRLFDGHESGPG